MPNCRNYYAKHGKIKSCGFPKGFFHGYSYLRRITGFRVGKPRGLRGGVPTRGGFGVVPRGALFFLGEGLEGMMTPFLGIGEVFQRL